MGHWHWHWGHKLWGNITEWTEGENGMGQVEEGKNMGRVVEGNGTGRGRGGRRGVWHW